MLLNWVPFSDTTSFRMQGGTAVHSGLFAQVGWPGIGGGGSGDGGGAGGGGGEGGGKGGAMGAGGCGGAL